LQSYNIGIKDANTNYVLLENVTLDSTSLNCILDTENSDTVCGGAAICSYQTPELASGTWFFRMQAVNSRGAPSSATGEITVSIK